MAKIDKEKIISSAKTLGESVGKIAGTAAAKAGKATQAAGTAVTKASGAVVKKATEIKGNLPSIEMEDVLRKAMKVPITKVDREKFLRKELIKLFPEETIALAVEKNPAYAGIDRETINKIAKQIINYETNKVTSVSAVAGLPGGMAMFGTVPADVLQYFAFILRATQKLAYLYGFPEFELNEDEVSDETLNQLLVFLGVMFGVQGANKATMAIARAAAAKVSRSVAQKALTKTAVYPIVKKVATAVGIRMTKEIFAKSIGSVVPVVGGVVSGGITYAMFKPCCNRLRDTFKDLYLSDPEFYRNLEKQQEDDWQNQAVDVDFTDVPEDDAGTEN